MESPPASVFSAARLRQQAATDAWTPGDVVIDGVTYPATVRIAPEQFELTERGPVKVQRVACMVRKSELAAAPAMGAGLVVAGLGFKVSEVSGYNSHDVSWRIDGMRTPGRDA